MQCPSCNKEASQAEFGEPLRCPGCGVFYAKAMAMKQRKDADLAVKAKAAIEKAAVINAAQTKSGALAPSAREHVVTRALNAPQPVVVVDIQMRFWSMVTFMVKWVLAAIPAMLILMFIVAGLVSLGGGLIETLLKQP